MSDDLTAELAHTRAELASFREALDQERRATEAERAARRAAEADNAAMRAALGDIAWQNLYPTMAAIAGAAIQDNHPGAALLAELTAARELITLLRDSRLRGEPWFESALAGYDDASRP